MLSVSAVTRSFGGQVVLDDITMVIEARDRVGIVGPNGVGKSTLLRTLVGFEEPDSGRVDRAPAGLTVGYLPQEPDALVGESLLGYLARRTGVAGASDDLDRRTEALTGDAETLDAYSAALETFLALGGADFESRAAETCAAVGLGLDSGGATGNSTRFEQATLTLSGGEAARAALAAILLSRVDVLVLDEPTNNLDFAGIDLLEAFVAKFPGAVVVVSHDRAFLDRCVDRIIEIDAHSHRARPFAGGWSAYVEARNLSRRQSYDAHDKFVAERDRLKQRQRTQVQWSDTGVRKTKSSGENDKNIRARQVARSEKQASKVKATERKIDQLEAVEKPWEGWNLQLSLAPTARSGDVVARLGRAMIEQPVGDPNGFRLGPIDLEIAWQDRLAILGPNGSGKSTLVGAILGTTPLASGNRWIGPGVQVGELDQARGMFAGEAGVLSTFQERTGMALSESRSLLAKFGLGADHIDRQGRNLSPGERTRALLATLMAQGVNCLVLDEPTNHLDIEAIEQLEQALAAFKGTVLLVSHDRRFLESVDITRTIELG
ncbi:MAG: ABC-F family ATP-binding cassette domain-containing protein [Actinomycetes bacterium]